MSAQDSDLATRRRVLAGGVALAGGAALAGGLLVSGPAMAASAAALDADADAALQSLYASNPAAHTLAKHSKAILIFPKIAKAGFMIGGETGDGVLKIEGKPHEYFNSSAASIGLQAGVQTFSYVLFIITQSALDYLHNSDGWKIGAGPNVVLVDAGAAASIDTTNLTQDVYAMVFGQQGLMAGVTIDGSKITRIHPDA